MNTTRDGRAAAPQEVWNRAFVKQHQRWCDAFVLELRLRDVAGRVIGDRLAEVEAHCAETGESPREAFGDAVDYAKQLDEPSGAEHVTGPWRVTVIAAVQIVAMLVGVAAVNSWARGEHLSYNVVQVASLAVLVLVILSLPVLLRPILERPWTVGLPVLTLGSLTGLGSAAAKRLDLPVVVHLPPIGLTVGLFVVVVVLAWAEYRELSRDEGDLITSPLAPAPDAPPPRRRWVTLLPSVLIPAAYVVFSAIAWLAN